MANYLLGLLSHGSNARDSSSPPARFSPVILSEAPVILSEAPVILSEAKDLAADRDRPFAARRRDTG